MFIDTILEDLILLRNQRAALIAWRYFKSLDVAGGEGFEPPLAESESAVLPLDDPPLKRSEELQRKVAEWRFRPQNWDRKAIIYRLENCGLLRAFFWPTFLRSTARGSRVT
jgi:hypothetical protein